MQTENSGDERRPRSCDLCGATVCHTVVSLPNERALRSDRTVVPTRLWKVSCGVCGLVRNGAARAAFSDAYYRDEYEVAAADHRFYTSRGPIARSALLAEWIDRSLDVANVDRSRITRVLEIGAGEGAVVAQLSARLPQARCEGFELSVSAAKKALARGISVTTGSLSAVPPLSYDLVYAVAVVEHVPSPTAFLGQAGRLLKPGGLLVLVQPTQDVASYDILFVDHLHHFASAHMSGYAAKCGFHERVATVGYECMPNFSLHVWQADPTPHAWRWTGPPATTTCSATAEQIIDDMCRLDREAGRLAAASKPFAVFGLNEVFALVRAYSSIEKHGVRCGLDDQPDRPEYRQYGFPVVTPELCREFGVNDVFLTMNKIYYEQATSRLTRLGLTTRPVLS